MSSTSSSNSTGRASDDQSSNSNDKFLGCCANCGVKETKDMKLKICTACKSVRYCGVECQKKHRSKHRQDCKKRAAELRDEILFKQPSHENDCPICCLPLTYPHTSKMCRMMFCCSQIICIGCEYANFLREEQLGPERKCPFCRSPVAETHKQEVKYVTKRIKANCPVAIRDEGLERYHDGKYKEAFDAFTKAAELGDIQAHYYLAMLYDEGKGVEKDEGKRMKHAETAAIGGHPGARALLSELEIKKGNSDRAVKHLIIAAKQGSQEAIDMLKECYTNGYGAVSKEVFAEALRGYQAALDLTKSPQREAAKAAKQKFADQSELDD